MAGYLSLKSIGSAIVKSRMVQSYLLSWSETFHKAYTQQDTGQPGNARN